MPLCETLTENPDSVSAWVELAEAWTAEDGPCPELLAALPRTDVAEVLGARAAVEALARGAAGKLRARAHVALARFAGGWPCPDVEEDGTATVGTCANAEQAALHARLAAVYDISREGDIGAWVHDETLRFGGACAPRGGGPAVVLSDRLTVCPTYGGRSVVVARGASACADGSGCAGLPAEPLPPISSDPAATVVLADEVGEGCVPPLRMELRDETGDGISEVWILRGWGSCGLGGAPGSWRRGQTELSILDGASGAVLLQGEVAVWDRATGVSGDHSVATALGMTREGLGALSLTLSEWSGTDEEQVAQRRAHPGLLMPGRYRYLAGAFRWVE